MNIEEILDDMDDLLDRSRPIPFAAHKAVIDADRDAGTAEFGASEHSGRDQACKADRL